MGGYLRLSRPLYPWDRGTGMGGWQAAFYSLLLPSACLSLLEKSGVLQQKQKYAGMDEMWWCGKRTSADKLVEGGLVVVDAA